MQRLVELGLVRREVPFGASTRDTKRTTYDVVDPFMRFWFRFIEPNRSRLEARRLEAVLGEVRLGIARAAGCVQSRVNGGRATPRRA